MCNFFQFSHNLNLKKKQIQKLNRLDFHLLIEEAANQVEKNIKHITPKPIKTIRLVTMFIGHLNLISGTSSSYFIMS